MSDLIEPTFEQVKEYCHRRCLAIITYELYYELITAKRSAKTDLVNGLPSAQPEIIRCKDCKHNPKEEWFGCPMSHLSEEQRPETAWCWKGERRVSDEQSS